MPEKKPVVGLTWQPPLPVSSSLKATDGSHIKTQIGASRSTVWKPTSELVDGLFAPPNDPRKLNKLLRKQVKDTAGKSWYALDCSLNPHFLNTSRVWISLVVYLLILHWLAGYSGSNIFFKKMCGSKALNH